MCCEGAVGVATLGRIRGRGPLDGRSRSGRADNGRDGVERSGTEPIGPLTALRLDNEISVLLDIKKSKHMIDKYPVITLCGSTRFKEQFMEAQKRLTLAGNIVISVGLFGHSGDDEVWTEGTKEMLDDMHKRKIDMADGIYVINVGGYIGQSTRSEIDYASAHGKSIEYLEKPTV